MSNENTTYIRIRDVFSENERTLINKLFKKYGINFIKKRVIVERFDMRKVSKNCNYISIKEIDLLLKKLEINYIKTKWMCFKESIKTVNKIRKKIETYIGA